MKNVFWSTLVFVALTIITYVLTGGKFVFGLFVFPLALIPWLFSRNKK